MKKILKLLSIVSLLLLFSQFPSKTFASNHFCTPEVNVDDFISHIKFNHPQGTPDNTGVRLLAENVATKEKWDTPSNVKNNTSAFNLGVIRPGVYTFELFQSSPRGPIRVCEANKLTKPTFLIPNVGQPTSAPFYTEEELRKSRKTPSPKPPPPPPCKEVIDPVTKKKTFECPTALGPIETDPAKFITRIFGIILSLAGGIALILIIVSGYRLMTSSGNPEKVQAAREQLTSAIVGLLFIIFSIAILTIIGVDILKIPGFDR